MPREKRVFKVDISGDERNIAAAIDKYLNQIKDKYGIVRNNQVAILCRSNSTAFKVGENLSTPFLLLWRGNYCSNMGKSPLPIESTTVEQLVTAGITSIAALIAWWKNNSFTKEAIAADAEYDRLRKQNGK